MSSFQDLKQMFDSLPAEQLRRTLTSFSSVQLQDAFNSLSSVQLQRALKELPAEQLRSVLADNEVSGLQTTAGKIRALADAGHPTAEIARILDIRYQHAYNVLKRRDEGGSGSETDALLESNTGDHGNAFMKAKVQIGAGGRIVIPAEMREMLGVKDGDDVTLRFADGELTLHSRKTAIAKARALVRKYVPEEHSLADELIAERRAEAARETAG